MKDIKDLEDKYKKGILEKDEYLEILSKELEKNKSIREFISKAKKSVFNVVGNDFFTFNDTWDDYQYLVMDSKNIIFYTPLYDGYYAEQSKLVSNDMDYTMGMKRWEYLEKKILLPNEIKKADDKKSTISANYSKEETYISMYVVYYYGVHSKDIKNKDVLSLLSKDLIPYLKNIPKLAPWEYEDRVKYILEVENLIDDVYLDEIDLDKWEYAFKSREITEDIYVDRLQKSYDRLEFLDIYISTSNKNQYLKSKKRFLKSEDNDSPKIILDTQTMLLYGNDMSFLSKGYEGIGQWKELSKPFNEIKKEDSKTSMKIVSNFLQKSPNYQTFHTIYMINNYNLDTIIPTNILDLLQEDMKKIEIDKLEDRVKYLFKLDKLLNINKPLNKFSFITLLNDSHSQIEQHQTFIQFLEIVIDKIDIYSQNKAQTLETINKSYRNILKLKVQNPLFLEIKNYMLTKFDFSFDNLKDDLLNFREESIEYLESVDNTKSIWELDKLSQKKIDFNFLFDSVYRRYNNIFEKIENYENNIEFLDKLFNLIKEMFAYDRDFYTNKKTKLLSILEDDYIENECDIIFEEWTDAYSKTLLTLSNILKKYFNQEISENVVLDTIYILVDIINNLEEFFETIRSGIVIKYQSNPKKDLLIEVDTQNRLFEIYEKSKKGFIQVIKMEKNKRVQRIINNEFNKIIDIRFKDENYFEEISEKFSKLAKKNLEIYLNDIEIYGKELEKRNMEISKLFFKMKRDLEKVEIQ